MLCDGGSEREWVGRGAGYGDVDACALAAGCPGTNTYDTPVGGGVT